MLGTHRRALRLPRVAFVHAPDALRIRRERVGRRGRRHDAQLGLAAGPCELRLGRLVRVVLLLGADLAEAGRGRQVARIDVRGVEAVEERVDPHLERGVRRDAQTGEGGELVESREIARIAHGDGEDAALLAERHRVEALRDAAGHESQDVRTDGVERFGRGRGDPVLDGEPVGDDVLGRVLLEEGRAETPAQPPLTEHGAMPLLVRDELALEQEIAKSRHAKTFPSQFTPRARVESAP